MIESPVSCEPETTSTRTRTTAATMPVNSCHKGGAPPASTLACGRKCDAACDAPAARTDRRPRTGDAGEPINWTPASGGSSIGASAAGRHARSPPVAAISDCQSARAAARADLQVRSRSYCAGLDSAVVVERARSDESDTDHYGALTIETTTQPPCNEPTGVSRHQTSAVHGAGLTRSRCPATRSLSRASLARQPQTFGPVSYVRMADGQELAIEWPPCRRDHTQPTGDHRRAPIGQARTVAFLSGHSRPVVESLPSERDGNACARVALSSPVLSATNAAHTLRPSIGRTIKGFVSNYNRWYTKSPAPNAPIASGPERRTPEDSAKVVAAIETADTANSATRSHQDRQLLDNALDKRLEGKQEEAQSQSHQFQPIATVIPQPQSSQNPYNSSSRSNNNNKQDSITALSSSFSCQSAIAVAVGDTSATRDDAPRSLAAVDSKHNRTTNTTTTSSSTTTSDKKSKLSSAASSFFQRFKLGEGNQAKGVLVDTKGTTQTSSSNIIRKHSESSPAPPPDSAAAAASAHQRADNMDSIGGRQAHKNSKLVGRAGAWIATNHLRPAKQGIPLQLGTGEPAEIPASQEAPQKDGAGSFNRFIIGATSSTSERPTFGAATNTTRFNAAQFQSQSRPPGGPTSQQSTITRYPEEADQYGGNKNSGDLMMGTGHKRRAGGSGSRGPPVPRDSVTSTSASTSPSDRSKKRDNWDKNIEFLLAVIGFAVDLGNVWRFPYICYKNGGGAFLIPYTIMFILGGLPIFYLEMSLGQYFSSGCLTVWKRVCPMAKGIGYAMCVLNFFTGLYYNTVISWAVFFFVESFTNELPWTSCNNSWNSPNCKTIEQRQVNFSVLSSASASTVSPPSYLANQTDHNFFGDHTELKLANQTASLATVHFSSPTKDYFEREVLKIHLSTGIDDLGPIRKPLALYLAIVFVCIYFAIWKGVKSTGKAVWITALLPYFVLIPLLIRGVFLEGAWVGIKYYLEPQWLKIADVDVWVEAAKQIYFSLGPGFGTLMALSSYNKFHHNSRKDALIAASVNYFASFISGLVIFAVLGYMATIENVSISDVATEGPGLVFQVYPEGLATMRFSSMWSVLFFIMVITLGIDSTFGGLESVITGLCDEYPRLLRAHRGIFIGFLIILIYICSLPTTTYGGNYVIYVLESYGTSLSLLFIVLIETIIVCWLYGSDRFCKNLQDMYGEMPGAYWRICWKYISPTILLIIFIAACGQELDKYNTLSFGDYNYPAWAPTVGLLMTGSSVCCIPVYALYHIKAKTSGPFLERIKTAIRPSEGDHNADDEVYVDAFTDKIRDQHDDHLDTVI